MKANLLRLALLVMLGAASQANAQTTIGLTRAWGKPSVVSTQAGSGFDLRNVRMCLVADTQNIVAQISSQMPDTAPPAVELNCEVLSTQGCVGENCVDSQYCHESWYQTGSMMMQNLAYDLIGQWDKIDWTKIKGNDNEAISRPANAPGHGDCDLILSLGDMEGIPSGDDDTPANTYVETYSYEQLRSIGYSYQVDVVTNFWEIIKASGIPYMPIQGNHDAWSTFKARMVSLGFADESWFYTKEATYELSYAILVPLGWGKSLCVVNLSWADANFSAARQAEAVTWLTNVTGCGGNHPTFVLHHDGVLSSDGAPNPNVVRTVIGYSAAAGVAGTSEIFGLAGGHYLSPASIKTSFTGLFGADADQTVFSYYSNWQQERRHAGVAPLGPTPSDSGGAWYTIIELQPDRDRICAYDWSPYWNTTQGSPANGQASNVVTTSGCQTFDFDARFP